MDIAHLQLPESVASERRESGMPWINGADVDTYLINRLNFILSGVLDQDISVSISAAVHASQ